MEFSACQVLAKYPRKSPLNWGFSAPVLKYNIKISLVTYLQGKDANYRIILDSIIKCFLRYGVHTCPSQESIAKWTGLCVRTVGTYLREMHAEGIIEMGYRHLKTSLYKISPHLLESKKWWRLTQLLPALGAWFRGHLPTISINRIFSNKAYIYLQAKQRNERITYSRVSNSARIINNTQAGAMEINTQEHAATPLYRLEKKERESMNDMQTILESVCEDKANIGNFLSPVALACGKKLGLNCYALCEMLCIPDVVLSAVYASLIYKIDSISNPKAYFFGTAKKIAQEKGIVLDFDMARRIQMRLADHQNQVNDFQYADHYNLPNENPRPAGPSRQYTQPKPQQSAPIGPRKGSYLDGNDLLRSNPDWPSHMKIGFLPKGMKYAGKAEFEKWAADPMYPWRVHPDLGELFEAGYNVTQIEVFLKAEAQNWTNAYEAQKEKFRNVGSVPFLGSPLAKTQEMLKKLNDMLQKISRPETGVGVILELQREGVKNDDSETKGFGDEESIYTW